MQAQNEDEAELTGLFYKVLDRYLPDSPMGDKAEISLDLFNVMKQWAVREQLTKPQPKQEQPNVYRIHPERTEDSDGNVTAVVDSLRILEPGDDGYDTPFTTEQITD
jgi:hypothetical protein